MSTTPLCLFFGLVLVFSVSSILCKHPHIIFIVADDMGWNDIGYHNPLMRTPTLNKLAKRGVTLESSYVQYICTPSRASILTGYYPIRLGFQHKSVRPPSTKHIPRNVSTLPEILRTRGYVTHMVGKWHLGFCNWQHTPLRRGFDSFFGYLYGSNDYYQHFANAEFYPEFKAKSWLTSGPLSLVSTSFRLTSKVKKKGADFWFNDTFYKEAYGRYSTELFSDRAVTVIERHDQSKPLFLYLAFTSPHGPLQVPPRYLQRCPRLKSNARRVYCGMVAALDEAVGKVTDAMRDRGMLDNSLLVFTSDNGGAVYEGGNNLPLRGAKTTLWEGGTRCPAFLYSPTLLDKSGYKHNGLFHAVDWVPTLAHLAGVPHDRLRGLDGVNQWKMLSQGHESARSEFLYNIDDDKDARAAVRVGNWKLIQGSAGVYNKWYPVMGDHVYRTDFHKDKISANATFMLFNIKDDPEERFDRFSEQPLVAQVLQARLAHYQKLVVPGQNPASHPKADPSFTNDVWTPGWC